MTVDRDSRSCLSEDASCASLTFVPIRPLFKASSERSMWPKVSSSGEFLPNSLTPRHLKKRLRQVNLSGENIKSISRSINVSPKYCPEAYSVGRFSPRCTSVISKAPVYIQPSIDKLDLKMLEKCIRWHKSLANQRLWNQINIIDHDSCAELWYPEKADIRPTGARSQPNIFSIDALLPVDGRKRTKAYTVPTRKLTIKSQRPHLHGLECSSRASTSLIASFATCK